LERGTDEEKYYKEAHLDNNTFTDGEQGQRNNLWNEREGGDCDGGRESFIEGEDVRVVVVRITDGRVSDWKGAVRDWTLTGDLETGNNVQEGRLVNGVTSS